MDDPRLLTIPRETANDDFVILTKWLVSDGQRVEAGTPVALFETSKATVELIAQHDGYLYRIAEESTEVAVGAGVARIEAAPTAAHLARTVVPAVPHDEAPIVSPPQVIEAPPPRQDELGDHGASSSQRWSKKAAELAKRHDLSRDLFRDKALVREEDVLAVLANQPSKTTSGPQPAPATVSTSQGLASPARRAGLARVDRIVPLSALKRTEIRYLRAGNADALVSAITVSVRAANLDALIAAVKDRRLTYLAVLLPVVARAVRDYPELNAFLDETGINYYADVNIGVAINIGEGLFVPVLPSADQMTSIQVASTVSTLTMKAVRGELREHDLLAGTFTITDLSDVGAAQVMPLLNRNQTAILAVGVDADRADARLTLTLAFDHRVSDGLQVGQFLGAIKQELEHSAVSPVPVAAPPVCSRCRLTIRRLREDGVGEYLVSIIKENGEQALLCPTCFLGFT